VVVGPSDYYVKTNARERESERARARDREIVNAFACLDRERRSQRGNGQKIEEISNGTMSK